METSGRNAGLARRAFCFLVFGMALLAGLCPSALAGADGGGSQLQLLGESPFIVGEPVVIEITVTNRTNRLVPRMPPQAFMGSEEESKFVIQGPEGAACKYIGDPVDTWIPGPRLTMLRPGQTLTRKLDLREYYDISKPGRYKCHLVYGGPQPENQRKSREFEFEVEERNGKFVREVEARALVSVQGHPAKWTISWRVFSHTNAKKTVLCAQRFGNVIPRRTPPFVTLGPVSRNVAWTSSAVDSEGYLHVLYPSGGLNDPYAYDVVSWDGKVRRVGLFKRAGEREAPMLDIKVSLKNAVPVEQGDRPNTEKPDVQDNGVAPGDQAKE